MSAIATPPLPFATPAANPLGLPIQALQAGLLKLTVDEYHALIRSGVIPEGPGYELIDGYVVKAMPKNAPHRSATNRLRKRLDRVLPAGWGSWIQEPITLSASEPEPDYYIARGTDDDYRNRHPGPGDVGLVIEVADSSLDADRIDKQRLYARAGIPVYWIVNIPEKQIEVYTDPQPTAAPPAYANRRDYKPGDAVPVALDGVEVATVPVGDVL